MATLDQVECHNEWNRTVTVHMIAGDRTKGIGYCEGKPVLVGGGMIQPAARPGDKWVWGDGTGKQWTVTVCKGREPYWVEMKWPRTADAGWKMY